MAKTVSTSETSAGALATELRDAQLLPPHVWREPSGRLRRSALAGLWLGALAGCVSLVLNVVGSVFWPVVSGESQHPLRLIQVYLTFPLGEDALTLNSGLLLGLGCLLYLATGMVYGLLFELALAYILPNADLRARLAACSLLALAVWAMSFYGLIMWLQPLVLGGRWIIDLIPWWVAVLTHLAFGWTMALLYPLGRRCERQRLVNA